MLTKSVLALVFASAAFVQAAPLPYPSGEPVRDPRTTNSNKGRVIVAPGIKISRRNEGCTIDGNILSGSCRWSPDMKTIIFDQLVSTPAKRGGVTWHTTPDGNNVVFDQPVSIAAKRDGCSVTADGKVVGDLCHMTPDGMVAFNEPVSIPAKRAHPDDEHATGCHKRDRSLFDIQSGHQSDPRYGTNIPG